MNDCAISVRNVGKRYLLGVGGGERYRAFRDVIVNSIKTLFIKKEREEKKKKVLWALKNVSFDIKKGEKIGIIGRNGAGKSTLLKILSSITEPSEGEIRLWGRVASLLEVGTGFHPELTGRENIFMNGAILGMSRVEIRRKYNEIAAFAEVESFLDTPVKRYSSGMYVRLAFAVAAHLDPEILLVDEVLAVGDFAFQKKCLGKMEDVTREGRTVLIVSHNMATIMNLCQRAILLDEGRVVMDADSAEVVEHYLAARHSTDGEAVWPDLLQAPGNNIVRLHAVRILQKDFKKGTADIDISREVCIQIMYWNLKEGSMLFPIIHLKYQKGEFVLASTNFKSVSLTEDHWHGRPYPTGFFQSFCHIPANFLNEGVYTVSAGIGIDVSDIQVFQDGVVSFHAYDTGEMAKEYRGRWKGPVVKPRLAWETNFLGRHSGKTK